MQKYNQIHKHLQKSFAYCRNANTNLEQSMDLKCLYSGSTLLPVLTGNLKALFNCRACLLVPAPVPCKMRYDLLILVKSKTVEPVFRRCARCKTTSGFAKETQLKICFLQAVEQQLARRSTYRCTDPARKWSRTREKAKNSAGPINQ